MKKIVFASNNEHKLTEVREKLNGLFKVLSLKDINCFDDIPETEETFEGNSELKANWVLKNYNYDCFADDSGLEVESLNNRPGVYSARYAGEQCNADDNNRKILQELEGEENRKARFVSCICLKLEGETHFFRGEVPGEIIKEYRGTEGFGYDPLFVPLGHTESFAEMSLEKKNTMSHRARALEKMLEFLS